MKKILNMIANLIYIPFFVLILPIILISVVIENFREINPYKELKFLKTEGFIFSKEKKPYRRKWIKGRICIMILGYNDYQISYDYDTLSPSYIKLYESEIGTFEERERLKGIISAYNDAHPRDQMDGCVDVHSVHIEFIKKNINQIINLSLV